MNTTFRQTKFTKKTSLNSNSKQNKSFFPNIDPYVGHNPYKSKMHKKQQQKQHISMITLYNINNETESTNNYINTNNNNNNINPQSILNNQSKGIDMWVLNNNLKQFSETRQIGFYKKNQNHQEKESSKSQLRVNNIINKNKNHQIKSINKIFKPNTNSNHQAGIIKNNNQKLINKQFNIQISQNKEKQREKSQGHLKKLYDPNFTARTKNIDSSAKNKSFFNQIYKMDKTIYGTLPVRKTNSHQTNSSYLNNTIYKANQTILRSPNKKNQKSYSQQMIQLKQAVNPYLKTFINGSHLKRRELNNSEMGNGNLQILQMNNNSNWNKNLKINMTDSSSNNNKDNNVIKQKKPIIVRKNKFEKYISNNNSIQLNQSNIDQQLQTSITQQPHNQSALYLQKPFLTNETILNDKKIQQKKKSFQYNKSIGLINKNLLNQVDDYLECNNMFSNIPKNKVNIMMDMIWGKMENQGIQGSIYGNSNKGKINMKNKQLQHNNFFFSDFSFKQPEDIFNSKPFPRGRKYN